MAADLASTPVTGIRPQISGDAHLANFGGYASPERRLVFDVNDFDETVRGPWEWDVKRLAASLVLAARAIGVRPASCSDAVRQALATYRTRTREYGEMSTLDVWYASIDVRGTVRTALDARARRTWERQEREARGRTALALLPKITEVVDGTMRFIDDPPLLERLPDDDATAMNVPQVLDDYRGSLRPDAHVLLERFRLVDVARKVVGVGSVGTWCVLALLVDDRGNPLLLQCKEARASVFERCVGPQAAKTHGERVVAGQRLMQAASDALLGWTQIGDRSLYVRQFRDMKAAPNLAAMRADELVDFADHCAWALARAHARSGDARAVGAYLGRGDVFDDAIVSFAVAYADQTEKDHAAFVAALPTGGFL